MYVRMLEGLYTSPHTESHVHTFLFCLFRNMSVIEIWTLSFQYNKHTNEIIAYIYVYIYGNQM